MGLLVYMVVVLIFISPYLKTSLVNGRWIRSVPSSTTHGSFQIYVVTCDNPESLGKLLQSLETAFYPMHVQSDITILVDRMSDGSLHSPTVDVTSSFHWSHGRKSFVTRDSRLGTSMNWIYSLDTFSSLNETTALIVHDSALLSPHYFTWLMAARSSFGYDESIAGFSLNRISHRADQSVFPGDILLDEYFHVVKYKFADTLAFSPRTHRIWEDFVSWYETHTAKNSEFVSAVDPVLANTTVHAISNPWLSLFMREYTKLYTIFPNPPRHSSLASLSQSNLTISTPSDAFTTFDSNAEVLTLGWDGTPTIFPLNERFLLSVEKIQSVNNGILPYIFVNYAYLNLTLSWICNLQALGADSRVVVIATDKRAYNYLLDFSANVEVAYYPVDLLYPSMTNSVSYGDTQYWKFTELRVELMSKLLNRGVGLLTLESDALWVTNCLDDIMSSPLMLRLYDDGYEGEFIAGFGLMLIRATEKCRLFFESLFIDYRRDLEKGKGYGEQELLSKRLKYFEINKDYDWLDAKKYIRGRWYKAKEDYHAAPASGIVLINNNYIIGNDKKEERAKLWKHWFVEDSLTTCRTDMPSRLATFMQIPDNI